MPNAVGYLMAYCTPIAELAGGAPTLDAAATQDLIARMERYRPNAPLSFMIGLSATRASSQRSYWDDQDRWFFDVVSCCVPSAAAGTPLKARRTHQPPLGLA